jgi:hypothetical protein
MDDLVKRVQATIDQPDKPNVIAMHVDDAAGLLARIEALEARITKADALLQEVRNFNAGKSLTIKQVLEAADDYERTTQ